MALINELAGRDLLIKIGNGATPEVFEPKCLVNADRGITFSAAETERGVTVDCDDPGKPGWQWLETDGLIATLNGAGKLHLDNAPFFDGWFRSQASKNIQIWLGTEGHWPGKFKLTGWEITGTRRGKAEASITLESDGEVGEYDEA